MIKKRIVFFTLLLISFLLINSCKTDKSFTVGLLLDDFLIERWNKDRDHFISEVEKLGGTVLHAAARGSAENQLYQAKEMINQGVDVLVIIAVDSEKAAGIIETAHQNNVQVIAYDRLIQNCELDFYISFNNVQVGVLQAEYMVNKSKGNYALINGPLEDNNSFLLKIGQLSILQKHIEKKEIKLTFDTFVESWTKKQGYLNMMKALDDTTQIPDVVICGNDALARGAISAFKQSDFSEQTIYFAGQDAELESLQSILRGNEQTMTVYKPLKKLASFAAKASQDLVFHKQVKMDGLTTINNNVKMVPTLLIEPIAVDASNLEETVIKDAHIPRDVLFN